MVDASRLRRAPRWELSALRAPPPVDVPVSVMGVWRYAPVRPVGRSGSRCGGRALRASWGLSDVGVSVLRGATRTGSGRLVPAPSSRLVRRSEGLGGCAAAPGPAASRRLGSRDGSRPVGVPAAGVAGTDGDRSARDSRLRRSRTPGDRRHRGDRGARSADGVPDGESLHGFRTRGHVDPTQWMTVIRHVPGASSRRVRRAGSHPDAGTTRGFAPSCTQTAHAAPRRQSIGMCAVSKET